MKNRTEKGAPPPVNFRAFLVVAAAVVGAVFCAYAFMLNRTAGIVAIVVFLAVILALVVVYAVKLKKASTSLSKFLAFALALVFSVCAFSFAAAYADFRSNSLDFAGRRTVDGRLCDADVRNGGYTLILDDLVLDGQSVKGKMRVAIDATPNNNADFLHIGDRASFSAQVRGVPLISGFAVDGTSFRTGVIFSCRASGDALRIEYGKPKPIEKFLSGVKNILVTNMGDRYGNIAYSMLTGDKYGLSSDVGSSFSAAGIGHILAVSGLHVGFLLLLVRLLLSRTNKYIRFGVTIALLVAYIVIADFSPSVIRASIMAVTASTSVFVSGRRDILSSLFFAFSCILAFRPVYLFEVGFLMSFGAIFGIAMFGNAFARFMTRHKVHNKISNSIATATSVQAGIIPTQAYFFGSVQPLAVLVNIFVLPYVGAVFIAVIVCLPFAAIPNCGMAVGWCRYLLMPIDYIARAFAALPLSTINISASCAAFLCYPIMFVMSEFFMLPKSKLPLIIFSAAVCAALCLIG